MSNNHFAVHHKLTQHCKSTILPFVKGYRFLKNTLIVAIYCTSAHYGNILKSKICYIYFLGLSKHAGVTLHAFL